ncbi:endonuclease/exonuclease/phosphatase family protein [Limnoglobus roseus]|uniref:Endonuclease/exonuclease/phosphatase domain-containing protein n=1 Tax=Limnoglobus roseus TaxID=2598579 RepID=A0A5C1AC30_9BACT|nr:endonuclease/exonuclease/phosphatase family protein [Limnoglobus roseus]QEL16135.1 hypothetical protein PX52LOC_03074 [Limnoglobus roseus]
MPLLVLALVALLGFGFVWLLFATSRAAPPYRVEGDTSIFRHGKLMQFFAVLSFFGAELILGLWVIFFPPRSNATLMPVVVTAVVLGLAGFLLIWEAFRFQLTTTTTGLDCKSPWKGRAQQSWSQVKELAYSPVNSWFALTFQDGRSFHVSRLVPGVTRFLESCERHLPPEAMTKAAPGYHRLGRKWPFGPTPSAKAFPVGRWLKRIALALVLMAVVGLTLFTVNGLVLATGETPIVGQLPNVKLGPAHATPNEVHIVAYNIAKGFAHSGGLRFATKAEVEAQLKKMAFTIRAQQPDLVFLSEAMTECGPANVDQVEFLARACGLPHYAFGENYNFGLPFYRVVGGNAILSRTPLTPVANISLAGRQPFYVTGNNRRALFAEAEVNGKTVLLGSLHNDSFNHRNNEAQVRQLLDFIGDRPCVLAGDFNATPKQESITLVKDSDKFAGAFDGPPTFPEKKIRIDYVFGPKAWKHVETRVLPGDASDHFAVVARFGWK